MEFGSLAAVFYAITFLVPGFIVEVTLSAVVPRRTESEKFVPIRLLTFSCVNHAVWAWLVFLVIQTRLSVDHPVGVAAICVLVILISPVFLGLMIGWLHQNNAIRKVLLHLGFNPVHVVPTSWDWKFSGTRPSWVLVTLNDGSAVRGFFGSRSFASSEPAERDLYIQEVFRENEHGDWVPIERTGGILLRADSIKHIEFWEEIDGNP